MGYVPLQNLHTPAQTYPQANYYQYSGEQKEL